MILNFFLVVAFVVVVVVRKAKLHYIITFCKYRKFRSRVALCNTRARVNIIVVELVSARRRTRERERERKHKAGYEMYLV